MGCNMCVVNRPEEQYRIMFQKGYVNGSLRPINGIKVRGRRLSQLPQERNASNSKSQDPLQLQEVGRKGHRRKCGALVPGITLGSVGTLGNVGTMGLVPIPDCVDNCTQTDISFQSILPLRMPHTHHTHPHGGSSPPLPHLMDLYGSNEFIPFSQEYNYPNNLNDPNDYFDMAHHEVDRQEELEYEEVELYKSSQQDKLGLTVCYRTEDEEDLGIYVGEVNPDSIAAKNGRIREGDRILQINGVDIQNREEAVAVLTRDDSTTFSLLLARPDIEHNEPQEEVEELEADLPVEMSVEGLPSLYPLRGRSAEDDAEDREWVPTSVHTLSPATLSQEVDSGVGRTDESTHNAESSEHDLLGDDQTSSPNTNTTNTPGSLRKFRPGHTPASPLRLRPDIHLSNDSLSGAGQDVGGMAGMGTRVGAYIPDTLMLMMPGLTEEECERYKELLEIRCQYEKDRNLAERSQETEGGWKGDTAADMNCNESLTQHEMALLEEELRHLEFKCRNILRAQKMQQLREQCMKAWLLEEEAASRGAPTLEPDAAPDHSMCAETAQELHRELSDINELPERERSDPEPDADQDKDSTSAYNTGGESCRSTPLVSTEFLPLSLAVQEEGRGGYSSGSPTLRRHRTPRRHSRDQADRVGSGPGGVERGHGGLNGSFSPNSYRKYQIQTVNASTSPAHPKFRSLTRGCDRVTIGSLSQRGVAEGGTTPPQKPRRANPTSLHQEWSGVYSAESSPYFTRRLHGNKSPVQEHYRSCMQLQPTHQEFLIDPVDSEALEERGAAMGSSEHGAPACPSKAQASPSRLPLHLPLELGPSSPRMEWKVKIRSDGTRYVAKRPVRDRLLKARANKIREERSGMTTDDDAVSEMKQGRYWSKEERKQQLLQAREHRRRREIMMQSRLDFLKGDREPQGGALEGKVAGGTTGQPGEAGGSPNILVLSMKKKKRSRRILDNWITIQELLAHGSRSPDGKKVYNPLLSVTTV
ncbi:hypothetical protein UPYG_G00001700 [Umbra pygmaea]|uniref:PDZ domain-containing protein n=1 Tax=Umbra pygmaea TaxID=75934 RepID=A0ABD0XGG6_UMBPY